MEVTIKVKTVHFLVLPDAELKITKWNSSC